MSYQADSSESEIPTTVAKHLQNEQNPYVLSENNLLVEDKDDPSTRCGLFKWKPDFLQKCNRPALLLACLSWFWLIQGKYTHTINNED